MSTTSENYKVDVQTLADAIGPVLADIKNLKEQILDFLPLETETSHQIAEHIFSSSGKMIRPALFFMTCNMLGYRGKDLYKIAAVAEYVHTASLLHDDVVDNSTMRRNKSTARSIWGDEAAVLVGDLIYSRASELMAETGFVEMVAIFSRAIRIMSEGELIQLENVYSFDIEESTYMRILTNKTGVLIGAACRAATVLAQSPIEKREAMDAFGHKIGIAFQLIDDALDYIGDEDVFGKSTFSDLIEGKVTMPVILLKNYATADELSIVRQIINSSPISRDQVAVVADFVHKYNTPTLTIQKAAEITKEALGLIQTNFPASKERLALENLAKTLLSRCN